MGTNIPQIQGTQPIINDNTYVERTIDNKQQELQTAQKAEQQGTIESSSGKTSVEIKKEIEALESEKALNYKKMNRIETQIKSLTNDMKTNMYEAKQLQEKAILENKEAAEKAVDDCVKAYVDANKEGGKGMTK